jgi:hypothetical protein
MCVCVCMYIYIYIYIYIYTHTHARARAHAHTRAHTLIWASLAYEWMDGLLFIFGVQEFIHLRSVHDENGHCSLIYRGPQMGPQS